jgi:uncharacterized membrane protein (DUF4010 family)
MDENEILTRLGLALAIGFLVGVERGWREREHAEGQRTAGLRTFALVGLSGGVWGMLAGILGPVPLAAGFLALAGGMTLYLWRESEHDSDLGATTLVAALLTFALGAYAVLGDMTGAAAAAVVTTALLAAKRWLHKWLETLTWEELRATVVLLAMSFVALPVLPNRGLGPFEALNPYALWLMTIAIAGVSFIGYVAVKVVGQRYGSLLAGVAGGLVSSTAATVDFARKAKAAPVQMRLQLAGALAASTMMFLRVGVIIALFGPALLGHLAGPLIAAAAVSAVVAFAFGRTDIGAAGEGDEKIYSNPFELVPVLRFAALLAAILIVSKALVSVFGGGGAIGLAAAAGLADVDAITLSVTQLHKGSVAVFEAELAILVAVVANSLSKSGIALVIGGTQFGLRYGGASLLALAAAAAVAIATLSLS